MRPCGWTPELIDAYVDGTATPSERSALEAHLAECAGCRADVEAITRLVQRARRLPRAAAPASDGWPDVQRAIHRVSPLRRALSSGGLRLAAGFLIVAALSSAATVMILDRVGGATTPVAAVQATPEAMASLARVEREYASVTRDLAVELAARRESLSPEARAVVERSLLVIDQAIAEARAALAQDPDNELLARMLAASYEQKLDLLRRAARLSSQS